MSCQARSLLLHLSSFRPFGREGGVGELGLEVGLSATVPRRHPAPPYRALAASEHHHVSRHTIRAVAVLISKWIGPDHFRGQGRGGAERGCPGRG